MVSPIAFLFTTFCSLFILHGLLVYKYDYFYAVEGIVIGVMMILYATLLVAPKIE